MIVQLKYLPRAKFIQVEGMSNVGFFPFLSEKKEEENVEYTVVDCFQQKFGPAVSSNESSYAACMTSKPVLF